VRPTTLLAGLRNNINSHLTGAVILVVGEPVSSPSERRSKRGLPNSSRSAHERVPATSRSITKSVVRGGADTGLHEVVSRHDTRPIQTTESRPPRGLARQRDGSGHGRRYRLVGRADRADVILQQKQMEAASAGLRTVTPNGRPPACRSSPSPETNGSLHHGQED
jgi:hypothetical protein